MSIATKRTISKHTRAGAFRATIYVALRAVPCLLLALLLGVFNPALCLLHCALSEAHGGRQAGAFSHDHHGHHPNASGATHAADGCVPASLPAGGQLTPRAAYELLPTLLALAVLAFALLAHSPSAPVRGRSAPPPCPLTPPPQILAFS